MVRFLLLLLIVLVLFGCQTPTADGFRENMVPKDTTMMVATSPITLPVYTALSVTDVAVVNPIRGFGNIPDWLSEYWQWGSTNNSAAVWWSLFPFKVVGTPLVILSSVAFSEQFIEE